VAAVIDSSRLSRLFEGVAAAADRGEHALALRLADSARRYAPDDALARIVYARSALNQGNPHAAFDALQNARDRDGRILCADAAGALGRWDEAARRVAGLLADHPVEPSSALAALAGRVCHADPSEWPGWVGRDTAGRVVGQASAETVTLQWDGGSQEIPVTDGEFRADWPAAAERLALRAGECALLGSELAQAPAVPVGWVVLEGGMLWGKLLPSAGPSPRVVITGGAGADQSATIGDAAADGSRTFWQRMDDEALRGLFLRVAVLPADGRAAALAGSPLRLPQPMPLPIKRIPTRSPPTRSPAPAKPDAEVRALPPPMNIVVPVYGGYAETMTCLKSVLSTLSRRTAALTVVDDASPDPEITHALDILSRRGLITLIRLGVNEGFPAAVNRGIAAYPKRDAVILNADTEVFPGWLERLREAAYSNDDWGTITPLGQAASIATYGNPAAESSSRDAARIDRIAQSVNAGRVVEVPVGVGFCLYIKRRCLNEVGEFDEHGFDRGYGEENDFCLRARRDGWRHGVATDVFVRHVGGRSFGAVKDLLMQRNQRVIDYRYPGYGSLIETFARAEPLLGAKRAIDEQRAVEDARKPVLLVSLALAGGVMRHVGERRAALMAAGHTVLTLRADQRYVGVAAADVRIDTLDLDHLRYALPQDMAALQAFLRKLGLVRLEIHHFLGLPPEALDMLAALGVPYSVSVHDYTWVCPRVSFIDGAGRYCGEPAVSVCETCVTTHGSALGGEVSVQALRERSARLLAGAARVIVPTFDVRARLRRYFPTLDPVVEAWEPPVMVAKPGERRGPGPVRVLLLGAIGTQKGQGVLLECAKDAAARGLPLEFVIVGFSSDDAPLLETGRVFMTGPYDEHEVAGLLEREACNVALFPTVGPETWCYTLTYALQTGRPIVAFDRGAVAERLRAAGTGVLLDPDIRPAELNEALLRAAGGDQPPEPVEAPSEGLAAVESAAPDEPVVSAAPPAELELTSTVQVLTLPEGLYAFTVQSGAAAPGTLLLPALQISPAPARSTARIEFLSGPATLDRWLTAAGDVVTVKISGGEAALLLTSLRGPSSGVLAVDVRRLDEPVSAGDSASGGAVPAGVATRTAVAGETRVITLVHLPYLGDLTFVEGWAGKPNENLWVEGFSVLVAEPHLPDLVEYCAVNESGIEYGWTGGGEFCGVRGTGIPLLGFGVRLKTQAGYTCRYRGRFLSGTILGPFDDGRLCQSEAPGDPLVAMEVLIEPI
jgi:GT2 family glycosyltransferase/glycosyltransferase involved in cell wall biosynthesis